VGDAERANVDADAALLLLLLFAVAAAFIVQSLVIITSTSPELRFRCCKAEADVSTLSGRISVASCMVSEWLSSL